MGASVLVWRVVDWDQRFETRGTLRKAGPRKEIAVSTDLEGGEQQKLLDASGGFMAFALWNLICRIAATSYRRGVLVQDGRALNEADLARLARCTLNLIQPALQLLESPDIRLLERVPLDEALRPPDIPAPLPRKPRIKPLLECPVCAADLTEYYQIQSAPPPVVPEPVPPRGGGCEHPRATCDADTDTSIIHPGTTDAGSVRHESQPPQTVRRLLSESERNPQFASSSPHPSWNPLPWIRKSTEREFEEMHVRFFLHEITRAELDHFLETHYYDEDDPDNEDWDDDDEEFQTDIPPPK